jgi:hypothetical protein
VNLGFGIRVDHPAVWRYSVRGRHECVAIKGPQRRHTALKGVVRRIMRCLDLRTPSASEAPSVVDAAVVFGAEIQRLPRADERWASDAR